MHAGLAAIAEPRREQIVRLVWQHERTAGDIASHFPVTFGAVSQHLKVLQAAGLVDVRIDGRKRWYIVRREAFGPLAAALEQMWFGKLGELKRLAEDEQARIDRERSRAAARAAVRHVATRQHPPDTDNRHKRGHR